MCVCVCVFFSNIIFISAMCSLETQRKRKFSNMRRTDKATEGSVVYDAWNPLLDKPVTLLIVAPRGSGKSVLLGDFLYTNRGFFDDVHVFAGSAAVFADFKHQLPPSRLSMGFSDDRMNTCMEQFKRTTEIMAEKCREEGRFFNGVIVLDDLGFDNSVFKALSVLEAFMNSRHARLSIVLCLQFVTSMPPMIRAQIDIVIALRNAIKQSQKQLHDFFFGIFDHLADFRKVMNKATENFGALVVNNRARSSVITRCIFTYRATERDRTIKLCSPRVWAVDRAARLLRRVRELEAEVKRKEMLDRGGMIM